MKGIIPGGIIGIPEGIPGGIPGMAGNPGGMPGGANPGGRLKRPAGGAAVIALIERPPFSPVTFFGATSTAAVARSASAASGFRAKAFTLASSSIKRTESFSDVEATTALTVAVDESSSPENTIAATPADFAVDGTAAMRTSATGPKRANERAIFRSVIHQESPVRHKTLMKA